MDNLDRNEIYDYIVIGAGSAGLAIAQLLQNNNYKVLVLESHSFAGGSSSYFHRGQFIFDVGATTLSGLQKNRPLELFQKKTGIKFRTTKIDPGIVYFFNNNFLERSADHSKWVKDFESFFKFNNTESFWSKEKALHDSAWSISNNFPYFPSFKFRHLGHYINTKTFSSLQLIPHLIKPLEFYLDDDLKKNILFKKFINEMLYITAQNDINHTPHLLAAMGLLYPEDTHYHWGGMKGFIDILSTNLPIKFQSEILKISENKNVFTAKTKKGEFKAKNIISTIPIWNTYDLLDDKKILNNKYSKQFFEELKNDSWSAFTLYFAVPKQSRPSLYYQVHFTEEEIQRHGVKSFFASFSHEDDLARAPKDFQTVTISIHIKPNEFFAHKRSDKEYLSLKNNYQEIIMSKFLEVFNYKRDDIQYLLSGSPSTFERYTKRSMGLVGGIPHDVKRIPFNLISPYTNHDHFYLLGDCVFPGQGIAATFQGALNLYNHLK